MLVREISLQSILERRVTFIETSTIYASLELKNVGEGVYQEILRDSRAFKRIL